MDIEVKFEKTRADAVIPCKVPGEPVWDLCSLDHFCLEPGDTCLVETGIKVDAPSSYRFRILPSPILAAGHIIFLPLERPSYLSNLFILPLFRLPVSRHCYGTTRPKVLVNARSQQFVTSSGGKKAAHTAWYSVADKSPFIIEKGMVVAQLLLEKDIEDTIKCS